MPDMSEDHTTNDIKFQHIGGFDSVQAYKVYSEVE